MSARSYFCIRGYMKSGTNWICRLLNLHPEIHSSGEFHWQKYFQAYAQNNQVFQNLANMEKKDAVIRRGIETMVRDTMDRLAPGDAKFVGDRTPHMLHPVVIRNAPHISIIRDCRDIIVSRMFHYFNYPDISNYFQRRPNREMIRRRFVDNPWYFHENPEHLLKDERFVRETARQWKQYLVTDRHTIECHAKLPVSIVKYEDLHLNLDEHLTKLVQFIGAEPTMMPNIPRHLLPGHREERPNSFNRKGVVGDWKNYINEEVASWINDEAGDELLLQNYISSLDWFEADEPKENQAPIRRAA